MQRQLHERDPTEFLSEPGLAVLAECARGAGRRSRRAAIGTSTISATIDLHGQGPLHRRSLRRRGASAAGRRPGAGGRVARAGHVVALRLVDLEARQHRSTAPMPARPFEPVLAHAVFDAAFDALADEAASRLKQPRT
ncbi:MAG: hypothetical protein R3C69_13505 [Geminicoccaceae bacterium]